MESSESLALKSNAADEESVGCDCCGFTEECTLPYISQIRKLYNGRWICGLCVEAVNYEILRSDNRISIEEALDKHIDFYQKYKSSSRLPFSDADHPILAMGKIMRRGLDSPTGPRSAPTSPNRNREIILKQKHCVDEDVVSLLH